LRTYTGFAIPYMVNGILRAAGLEGALGPTGPAGSNAYGLAAGFTQPQVGTTIAIQVPSGIWMQTNQYVYIPSAGYYQVASGAIPTFSLKNLGYSGVNIPVGSTIATGNISPGGVAGVTGATGPAGTGNMTYGGDITTGPTGPLVRYLSGYTSAALPSGDNMRLDIYANQTRNIANTKVTIFTDQIYAQTTVTGWANILTFSLDDNIAGATATINHLDVSISAITSLPTAGWDSGTFKLSYDVLRAFNVTNGVPSGTVAALTYAQQSNNNWGITAFATGATGVVQVNSQSTATVQWGGFSTRTRTTQ
jgi:hypothetical protein